MVFRSMACFVKADDRGTTSMALRDGPDPCHSSLLGMGIRPGFPRRRGVDRAGANLQAVTSRRHAHLLPKDLHQIAGRAEPR